VRVGNITEADALVSGIHRYLPPVPFPPDWPQNAEGKYLSSYGTAYASDRSGFACSAVGAFARQWGADNRRYPWESRPWAWWIVVRRIES